MNVVVTGASSFIGSAAAKELIKQGHKVYAIVRPDSKNIYRLEGMPESLHIIPVELGGIDKLKEKIEEPCQIFIHLGWDGAGSDNRADRAIQQKNVEYSMKALQTAESLGCRRFIFSGSQAEYGICNTEMTEELNCNPVSEYGKAKVDFYNQAVKWCEIHTSVEYVHVRIFSIYGPQDHPWSLVSSCLKTFENNEIISLGECTQQWNFLHVKDLVDAIITLASWPAALTAEGCVYNIAGSSCETRPLREYVEIMHELCGNRGSFVYGKRALNAEGPSNLIPCIKKITEVTGWSPKITFREGITEMLSTGKCIVCGESLDESIIMELKDMPSSAQNIPDAEHLEDDKGISLKLCQCRKCGLVQFDCEPVEYYKDVIRSGGFSTTMVELRRNQYRHFIDKCGLEGKKIIEAGCGRGEFLSVLEEFPVKAYGIEHRADLVGIALNQGLSVWYQFAENEDTTLESDMAAPPYDAFLSFNFLEHQPNPSDMLRCLYNNLTENGVGLITVPSLEYILKYDGYYELIRDHLAYYTFGTLRYLLNINGFEVIEEEMVNRDTLSVIVRKNSNIMSENEISRKCAAEKVNADGLEKSREIITNEIDTLLNTLSREGKSLAVWGASHQGFTLASTTKLGNRVKYIIDSAPFKQGRFAPASHIPIVAPDYFKQEPVEAVLIAAPGYTDEIAGIIRRDYGDDVKILTLRSNHIEEI